MGRGGAPGGDRVAVEGSACRRPPLRKVKQKAKARSRSNFQVQMRAANTELWHPDSPSSCHALRARLAARQARVLTVLRSHKDRTLSLRKGAGNCVRAPHGTLATADSTTAYL